MATCQCSTIIWQITAVVGVLVGLSVSQTSGPVANDRMVQLCGPQLADMLGMVCQGRGFHFKRAASFKLDMWKRTRWNQGNSGASVVTECCTRPCTISTLESYCAASAGHVSEEAILRHLYGNTRHSPVPWSSTALNPTTTQSSAHYDPNEPSAQVFRGPSAGSANPSFFYVQKGSRPTRTPLLLDK